MEITWTVEYFLFVTNDEMKDMADVARDYIRDGYDREEAIKEAVGDYLSGQDDSIFYGITKEACAQIEEVLNKILTE